MENPRSYVVLLLVPLCQREREGGREALRFIYNDYVSDYDTLIALSKMPTRKLRRLRTMILDVFEILHKESPVYLHDLICFKNNH